MTHSTDLKGSVLEEDDEDADDTVQGDLNSFMGDIKHKSLVRASEENQDNTDINQNEEEEEEDDDLTNKTEAELLLIMGPLRARRSEGGLLNRKVRVICENQGKHLLRARGRAIDFISAGGIYTIELDSKSTEKALHKEMIQKEKEKKLKIKVKNQQMNENDGNAMKEGEPLSEEEDVFGEMALQHEKVRVKQKRKFIRLRWQDIEDYKYPKNEEKEETEKEKKKRELKLKKKELRKEERRANRPMAGLLPAKPIPIPKRN